MIVEHAEPHVGLQIRAIRERQGLSLRALAEQCGLSANAISLIERGENSPTVSSLRLLATALKVPITDFFEYGHEQATVFVKQGHRLRTEANGMVMESLGIGLWQQQLEPFLITLAPGSGDVTATITHPGQEFVFCLGGEVEYVVGIESYRLQVGDSLLFEATQPHGFFNCTATPATLLVVFQGTEGSQPAQQHHLGV